MSGCCGVVRMNYKPYMISNELSMDFYEADGRLWTFYGYVYVPPVADIGRYV